MLSWWVLGGAGVLVVVACTLLYNRLVKLRNRVDNAWSQVDVQLRRRYDLIPNLVSTVKAYAAHESETLEGVVKARDRARSATTIEEQGGAESALTGAIGNLLAVAEAYPELRSVERFAELQQDSLGDIPARLRWRVPEPALGETHAEGCPAARPLAGLPPLPGRLQPHGGSSPGLARPLGAVPGLRYRARRCRTGTVRCPPPRPARGRPGRQLLQPRLRRVRSRTHQFHFRQPRERFLQCLYTPILFQFGRRRQVQRRRWRRWRWRSMVAAGESRPTCP